MTDDLFSKAAASIVEQDREAAVRIATEALAAGIAPAEIMQSGFVAGIAQVGELFESGELFLPELMMAAQAMEGAMSITNAALNEGAAQAKGTIVLGTVQGDVHDIGKAIVIAYLKANSYEVHDLGRHCPSRASSPRPRSTTPT
jgi:trimethylamine corrinoid protein